MFTAICVVVALVQAVLFATTGAPERDQAEQLVLAQSFALAYPGMQPPLYTWGVRLLIDGAGLPPLAALALPKTAGLLALLAGVRALARELGLGARRRLLAVALLALMPKFLWEAQRDITHSVVAAAAVAWMLAWVLRSGIVDPATPARTVGRTDAAGTDGRADATGAAASGTAPAAAARRSVFALPVAAVCAAVALLSKYNAAFPVAVAGLLLLPRRRGAEAARLAACAALTAALVAPHAIALALHARAVDEIGARVSGAPADAANRATILARESIAFTGLVGVAIGAGWLAAPGLRHRLGRRAAARPALRQSVRAGDTVHDPAHDPAHGPAGADPDESVDAAVARRRARHRFLLQHLVLTAALSAAALVLGGTPDFRDRWLMPLLVALPVLGARWIVARAIAPMFALCGALFAASEALLVVRHPVGPPLASHSAKPWAAMLAPAASAPLALPDPGSPSAGEPLWTASNRSAAAWRIARAGAPVRVAPFDDWLVRGSGPYLWSDEEALLTARLNAAGCRFRTLGRAYGLRARHRTTLHATDRAAASRCLGRPATGAVPTSAPVSAPVSVRMTG